MTLDAPEFIRRFLLHVLPDGFVKIRYFGLAIPQSSVLPEHCFRALLNCAQPYPVMIHLPLGLRTCRWLRTAQAGPNRSLGAGTASGSSTGCPTVLESRCVKSSSGTTIFAHSFLRVKGCSSLTRMVSHDVLMSFVDVLLAMFVGIPKSDQLLRLIGWYYGRRYTNDDPNKMDRCSDEQ